MRGKTTFITIALLCLFAGAARAQDSDEYDFRKTRWGMSPTQVKASENKEPAGEGQDGLHYFIVYTGSVAGLEVEFGYTFIDNKLVETGYLFPESYTNQNRHIVNYKNVKEILTRKYGPPYKDKTVWNNDLFKDDSQNYGTAVSVGHLGYQSDWQTPTTDIRLTLKGENFKTTMGVVYTDRKSRALIESLEKKSEEKDF